MAGRQTLDLSIGVRIPVPQSRQRREVNGSWLMVHKGSVRTQLAEPEKLVYIDGSEEKQKLDRLDSEIKFLLKDSEKD